MNYWLMKSEPEKCSVDNAMAAPNATAPWVGARTLPELRANDALQALVVLRKGNRLSITPVEPQHWRVICKLLGNPAL
jgi:predicted RNA-binding protein with PUA-like domain